MKGTVKWFNNKKGYGFITGEDGKDYFFHYSQIQMQGRKALFDGDIVYFEISEPDKNNRVQALNVEPVLTLAMIRKALKKEKLYVKPMKDGFGNNAWIVIDENQILQSDERGMSFEELAAYAGFSISEE